jgi:putative addiction module component (TIGR02574 family)
MPGMSTKVEQIVEQSRQLSRGELAELVDLLTIEIAAEPSPEHEAAWVHETQRRLDEIRSGKVPAIPGEEVMARARKIVGL